MRLGLGVCLLAGILNGAIPHGALGVDAGLEPAPACNGDCNGDHVVSIDELVQAVGSVLGSSPISRCPGFICPDDPPIAIDCLLGAVNNALVGCPAPTPTPVPPKLSLGLRVSEFPDQQQTVVVAALRHLGGSTASYLTGCTAQCEPLFFRALTFDVFSPFGERVRVECEEGGPYHCPEQATPLAAGEALTQTLTIDGTAWERTGDVFPTCGACREGTLPPGRYMVVATFTYGVGAGFPNPRLDVTQTAYFDWPPTGATPEPTTTPPPTPVFDCRGVPDANPCIGPCGPCHPSVHGYCAGGICRTECAPCVTATPVPSSATCTPTPTFRPVATWTRRATGTPTRTCASRPSPPVCPAGEGAACEDQQCLVNCGCGTVTPTPTPTNSCTPGAHPPPGCGYEGPTFTATPLCASR